MQFEIGHLYHIYNQGNNRQNIFFNGENYRFFLKKIETHVLPFADILAWCLMPNHFHLMVHVNEIEVDERLISPGATSSRARTWNNEQSRARTGNPSRISFNKSIGIMLASYTRAINKQQVWSGSLFRKETKAICLTQSDGISPAWYSTSGITRINIVSPENEYPNMCFNYILYNPVKDGLVKRPEDWEFSSYYEISENRIASLLNKTRIKEYGLEVSAIKSGCDFESRPD